MKVKHYYVVKTSDNYVLDDQLFFVDDYHQCGLFEAEKANEILEKMKAEGKDYFFAVPVDEVYQKPKIFGFQYDDNHIIEIAAFSEKHAISRLGTILVQSGFVASLGEERKG